MSLPGSNLERYEKDLETLVGLGQRLLRAISKEAAAETRDLGGLETAELLALEGTFEKQYQGWYTEALAVVRQLIPDRLAELKSLYEGDGRRKVINETTYTIQDWMTGIRAERYVLGGPKEFVERVVVRSKLTAQLRLLESARSRFKSSLHDIRQIVQAELFDSELDSARGLKRTGHLRAAGAVAGVVLEGHLRQVCSQHQLMVRKKAATIADYNETLKASETINVATWRFIQHLGDLRNQCDHVRDREPSTAEVSDLIDGVVKITKTVS